MMFHFIKTMGVFRWALLGTQNQKDLMEKKPARMEAATPILITFLLESGIYSTLAKVIPLFSSSVEWHIT
jgi:hypothetical protein